MSSIRKSRFGALEDRQAIESWILTGSGGLVLEVLTHGGIVRRLLVPDKSGRVDDVVLGYSNLEAHENDPFFMGATVGRIAGRIAGGQLKLPEGSYDLPINDPPNHLHGGSASLPTKVWKAEPLHRPDGAVSLTHHGYFNLSGEGCGNILGHRAEIFSSQTVRSDERMTLLNQLEAVDSRPADMRRAVRLGSVVPELWRQHGDLYWLGDDPAMKPAARVSDPDSGRILTVHTTNTCLQTYFSAARDNTSAGKSGRGYEKFGAFSLECEGYPQAASVEGFGDIMVHPGSPQKTCTVYAFTHTR